MTVLITGACGPVGGTLAEYFRRCIAGVSISGIDNLMRAGSETNRERLTKLDVKFVHGDIRNASDVDALPVRSINSCSAMVERE